MLYTVRKLSREHVNDHDVLPAHVIMGWWGVFRQGYDAPLYVGATDGDCLMWVRQQGTGSSAVVDRKTPAPAAATVTPEAALIDAPVGTCDRCGALAYVEMVNGPDVLTFCLHHHRDNAAALTAQGYSILRDARHLLTF